MIKLRCEHDNLPSYMTSASACADVSAAEDLVIPPLGRARVATGIWIESVDWSAVPKGSVPELQIRARSGLAYKKGIMLVNGVGTVDADYPDEIGVLLWNGGEKPFEIQKGDRIAQMCLNLVHRLPDLEVGGQRQGGFGSTGA